ncbi:glucosamine-6-phosphate deaminase [Falsarthrobacter nasiphocae]|uniref:Glucosamine-6-phosphate deaminase n=1 Tax=Falsarthrobacter nasiphocae TaxID=189863 RepID=A0AAE4C6G4_9MICC|nr:glucosamine-6-phosphate deaminase [Falsarthrobacter nasiphocae]MDR6892553.1 glucosamine-6-phosphate deaminase [Falsarthrobacter nasiphocae]
MEIIVEDSAEAAGETGSRAVIDALASRPDPVLGLATGSSPEHLYASLARASAEARFDPRRVTAFALDEYLGLDPAHPQSYRSVVDREVTRPLGLDPARVHVLDGGARNADAECRAYERAIQAAGGVDIQILGIGANGHIGFNEPGSSFQSRTRRQRLDERTRRDNARFFGGRIEDVPQECLTQGIGTIREARQIVLVASGAGKAEAVSAMIQGPVGEHCPATALRSHPSVLVLLDREAASQVR